MVRLVYRGRGMIVFSASPPAVPSPPHRNRRRGICHLLVTPPSDCRSPPTLSRLSFYLIECTNERSGGRDKQVPREKRRSRRGKNVQYTISYRNLCTTYRYGFDRQKLTISDHIVHGGWEGKRIVLSSQYFKHYCS